MQLFISKKEKKINFTFISNTTFSNKERKGTEIRNQEEEEEKTIDGR